MRRSKQRGFFTLPAGRGMGRPGGAGGVYYTAVMADAPLLYLRLAETSGTAAADASGNSRSGTYVNSPTLNQTGLLDAESNAAAVFNGSTQSVTIAYGSWMNSGQTFTAEGLVNWAGGGSGNRELFSRRELASGTAKQVWTMSATAAPSMILVTGGAAVAYSPMVDAAASGVRRHQAQTFSSGRGKLFVNGRLVLDVGGLGSLNQPTDGGMRVMAAADAAGTPADFADGTADEIAFYGTALSAARIAAHAAAAGITVVTDTYAGVASTARSQYALRAINGYTGALLDVRRSSDNATRTINVSAGELDTADLLTWAGSDSVFVSRWYDQSGNGHHLEQATNASQPRIVNAGTLEMVNSKPVVNFSTTSLYLRESGTSLLGTTDSTTILVATDTAGFGRGQDGFGSGWSISNANSSHAVVFTAIGLSSYSCTGTNGNSFGAKCFRIKNSSGDSRLAADENGYQIGASANTNSSFRTSTVGFEIARSNGGGIAGKVGEVLVWRSVIDHGKQQAVTDNWGTRFGF